MLLTLVFACSKGCGNKSNTTNGSGSNNFSDYSGDNSKSGRSSKYGSYSGSGYDNDSDLENYGSSSHGSYSGGSSGGYYSSESSDDSIEDNKPLTILTDEESAQMIAEYKKQEEILEREAAKLLEEQLKKADSPKAIEQYKLKSNKNYVAGKNARRRKDYEQAIKLFNEVCKDPNSSPVTKYFAISNLMGIAQEMKDLELYFIAARMNAALCAKEDLKVLGIEKTNDLFEWANKVEMSLKARDDKTAFDECVRVKIENYKLKKLSQKEAEELVRKDIKLYSNIYKEFFE